MPDPTEWDRADGTAALARPQLAAPASKAAAAWDLADGTYLSADVPADQRAAAFVKAHALVGSSHEELDRQAQGAFPDADLGRLHQEFGLEQARQKFAGKEEGAGNYFTRKVAPGVATGRGIGWQMRVNRANEAYQQGKATPGDLDTLAQDEWQREKDRQYQHGGGVEGFLTAAADKAAGIVPIAGEMVLGPGGRAAGWVGNRIANLGAAQGAARVAPGVLGKAAGAGIALPLTVPALSPLKGAAERAGQTGGDVLAPGNIAPAWAESTLKATVLGAVQSQAAGLPLLARAPVSGSIGAVEAAVADRMSYALGLQPGRGEALDAYLQGKHGEAARAAALDAVTFSAFAALHPRQPRKPGEKPDPKVVAADAEAYQADGHTVAPDGSVKPPEPTPAAGEAPPAPPRVRDLIDSITRPEPAETGIPADGNRISTPPEAAPEKPVAAEPSPAPRSPLASEGPPEGGPSAPEPPPAPDPLKLLTPAEISQFARANGVNPAGSTKPVLRKLADSPTAWGKLLTEAGRREGRVWPPVAQDAPGSTTPPPAGVRPPTGENAPTGRQGPALTRRERLGQLLAAAAAAKPHDPLAGRLHDVIKNAGLAGRVNEGLSSDVRAAVDYPSGQPGKSLRLTVEHLPDRNALEVNFEYASRLGGLIDRTVGMPHAAGLTLIRDLGKIAGQAKAAGLDVTFKAEPGRAALYDRGLRKAGYSKAAEHAAGPEGMGLKEYVYKPARPAGEVSGRPATLLEKLRARQAAKADVAKTAAPVTAARGRTEFGPPAEAARPLIERLRARQKPTPPVEAGYVAPGERDPLVEPKPAADPLAKFAVFEPELGNLAEPAAAGAGLTHAGALREAVHTSPALSAPERAALLEFLDTPSREAGKALGASNTTVVNRANAAVRKLAAERPGEFGRFTTAEEFRKAVAEQTARAAHDAAEKVAGGEVSAAEVRQLSKNPEVVGASRKKLTALEKLQSELDKHLDRWNKETSRGITPERDAEFRARADTLARRLAAGLSGEQGENRPAQGVPGPDRPVEPAPAGRTPWQEQRYQARLAKEKAALAAAAERKKAVDAKAAKPKPQDKSEYALATVQHLGGIDPKSESFLAHYGSYREAIADGVPLRAFRSAAKGGRGLDQIAQEMAARGELPSGEPQHVLDLLRNKAPTAAADTTAAVGARAAARDAADRAAGKAEYAAKTPAEKDAHLDRLEQAKAEHAERMGMDEGFDVFASTRPKPETNLPGPPPTGEHERGGYLGQAAGPLGVGEKRTPREFAHARSKVTEEREKRGMSPVEEAERRTNAAAWAMASAEIARNPNVGRETVERLLADPESVRPDTDIPILHVERVRLSNAHDAKVAEYNQLAGRRVMRDGQLVPQHSPEELEPRRREAEDIEAMRNDLDRAVAGAGTQMARGMQYFRQLAREDYTLAGMLGAARMAKNGKELTPAEKMRVTRIQKEIEDAGDGGTPESRIRIRRSRQAWGETINDIKDRERPPLIRGLKHVGEGLGLLRAFKTAYDFSAVLRQGGMLTFGHPLKALSALRDMLTGTFSKAAYERNQQAILDRPNSRLYETSGLYLADTDGPLSRREEGFITRYAKHVPLLAASERAYAGYLNRIRADVFDAMAAGLARNGRPTAAEAKAISNFVNVSTGRGPLGAKLEPAGTLLAQFFFAPRYALSRFQLLAGQPFYWGSGQTRKLIIKEYLRTAVGLAAAYGLAKAAGAGLEDDPRSSDFGKWRFGRTRIDPLAGEAQPVTFLARNLSGKTKPEGERATYPLAGPGRPHNGLDFPTLWTNFVRSKLSPLAGVGGDLIFRKTVRGDAVDAPVDLPFKLGTVPRGAKAVAAREAGQLLVPLAPKDVYEAVEEEKLPKAFGTALLGLLGMGTSVHEPVKK